MTWKKQKSVKKSISGDAKREAMFMGLVDIVFPGSLVVSAMTFLAPIYEGGEVIGWSPTLESFGVAICTLVGSMIGYTILMRYVMKGRPQAGLPLLNSGAIIGYLATYLLVFQDLSFGLVWWW